MPGKQIYTDEELLNFLKKEAARLGRAPTSSEIDSLKNSPSSKTYCARFGRWSLAWDLTAAERKLMAILGSRCGRENAISSKELSAILGLKDVEIRTLVRHLIMEHHYLIGSVTSMPAGFFKPVLPEEVMGVTKSLRRRGISILVRASRLQRTSLEDVFNQGRMEFNHDNR